MRNKIKNSFLILTTLVSLASCKKDISLSPVFFEPTTFTTEAQLVNQLAGVYAPLQQDQMYAQGMWGYLEAGTDESFRSGSTSATILTQLYNIASSETNVGNFWRALYNGVERANVLIDGANSISMDTTKKKNFIGQAKFLRAFYNYILVSRFGGTEGIPVKNVLSTDMGTNFNIPRTSSKEVYEYIIKEMTEAEGMVPAISTPQSWQSAAPTTSVVSKSAIQAILARVCLNAAGNPVNDNTKYQLALDWAKKLINSGSHSLNSVPSVSGTPAYANLFINNMRNTVTSTGDEGIWDAVFTSKSNSSGTYANTGFLATQTLGAIMGLYSPDASASALIGYSAGVYRTHNRLYRLYGPGDQRRDWAIAPYVYKNSTNTRYYTLTVNLTGGGGTGAMATAYTSATGAITSVVIDNPGSGYTSAPVITFSGYATNNTTTTIGTGATATAVVSGGKITAINVTAGGSGYPTAYERCVGKWRREYETNIPTVRPQNNTSCNFPIVRYADVLLMAAEADLKVNGTPSVLAVEYYNQVRRRAYGLSPTSPAPGVDVATFTLQDIMDERSRELCFEGVRRIDLIRWGVMATAMQNTLNDVASNAPASYTVAASLASNNFLLDPNKYALFPIPSAFELAQNSALTQNAGW